MATVDEMVVRWSLDSAGFTRGASTINDSMNALRSEFRASDSYLQNFGDNTERLQNRQQYLTRAMDLQRQQVETLRQAYERSVSETGENSRATQTLANRVNNAATQYNRLEGQLIDVNEQLEGTSEEGEQAAESVSSIGDKFETVGGKISAVGEGFSKYITAPLLALGGIATEGTEELRTDLSKLEQVAKSTGNNWEQVNTELSNFVAISDESDSSIEALNNLMMAGIKGDTLADVVNQLSGAVIAFPDTLKVESLADSIQETVKTGKGTGQFVEFLDRMGVNTEEFNIKLSECKTESERMNYALSTLSKTGIADFNKEYQESNKELLEGKKATFELQQSLAKLGEVLAPIMNKLVKSLTKVLDIFNKLSPEGKKTVLMIAGILAAIGPGLIIIGKVVAAVKTVITVLKTVKTAIAAVNAVLLANPVVLIIAAIVALVATVVILYKKCEWFREGVKAVFNGIKEAFFEAIDWIKEKWNSFKELVSTGVDIIKRTWKGLCDDVSNAWNKAGDIIKDVWNGVKETVVGIAQGMVNAVIKAINFCIRSLNKLSFNVPDWVPGIGGERFGFNIKEIQEVNWLYKGGIIDNPTVLGNIGVGDRYKGTGSNAEAIIPLDSMYRNLRSIVKEESTNQSIYVVVNVDNNMDSKAISKAVTTEVTKNISRNTKNYTRAKGGVRYA